MFLLFVVAMAINCTNYCNLGSSTVSGEKSLKVSTNQIFVGVKWSGGANWGRYRLNFRLQTRHFFGIFPDKTVSPFNAVLPDASKVEGNSTLVSTNLQFVLIIVRNMGFLSTSVYGIIREKYCPINNKDTFRIERRPRFGTAHTKENRDHAQG